MSKKVSKKKLILSIILIILLIFICFGIYFGFNGEKKAVMVTGFKNRIDTVNNYSYEDLFIVGWLQVQGTNIDTPIFTPTLPTREELGTLDIDVSYGWRSSEYVEDENREVIMGHNIINVSSKPLRNSDVLTDFEDLMEFVYYDFATNNLYISYTKNGVQDLYAIYAVGFDNYEDDYNNSISDKNDILSYIKKARDKSIYDYDIDVDSNDEIISIVTCTRFFGYGIKNQFRVDARKLREDEKTYIYSVNKNDNYDVIEEKLNEVEE